MGIYKHRDGWRVEVFYKGKRVASRSGFKRKTDANLWYEEQRSVFKSETAPAADFTFDDLLKRFDAWHLARLRGGTRARYLVDIDHRIRPFFAFLKLSDLTSELLEAFRAEISQKLKPKSVNNCIHALRLILNKGVKWRMLAESPYDLESAKVPRQPYPWWEAKEDIAKFLEVAEARSRYFPVYLTALETGMRYGELIGLCKGDIDFKSGTIHVHRQWLEREGDYGPVKHGKPRWLSFDPDSRLGRVLWDTVMVSNGSEALFTTQTGCHPGKSGVAEKYFKAIQRAAGLPQICFHGLRHTFASWYMLEHDNVWDLMALLGHSSVTTTMRYAHHSRKTKRKPLNLASVVTHNSHTRTGTEDIRPELQTGKEWRDGRDLNSKPPLKLAPAISVVSKQ